MSHHRAEGPISVHSVFGKIRVHLPDDRMEELGLGIFSLLNADLNMMLKRWKSARFC